MDNLQLTQNQSLMDNHILIIVLILKRHKIRREIQEKRRMSSTGVDKSEERVVLVFLLYYSIRRSYEAFLVWKKLLWNLPKQIQGLLGEEGPTGPSQKIFEGSNGNYRYNYISKQGLDNVPNSWNIPRRCPFFPFDVILTHHLHECQNQLPHSLPNLPISTFNLHQSLSLYHKKSQTSFWRVCLYVTVVVMCASQWVKCRHSCVIFTSQCMLCC